MSNYQLNPLLESEGLLKIAPKKTRDGVAWYLRKIRSGSKLDPVMIASMASPVPGTAIIGNSYVRSVDPYTRARAYRLVLDRPDKALVKGVVGVPKAVVKTTKNIPKATVDFVDDVGEKTVEIAFKHGVDLNKIASNIPVVI